MNATQKIDKSKLIECALVKTIDILKIVIPFWKLMIKLIKKAIQVLERLMDKFLGAETWMEKHLGWLGAVVMIYEPLANGNWNEYRMDEEKIDRSQVPTEFLHAMSNKKKLNINESTNKKVLELTNG